MLSYNLLIFLCLSILVSLRALYFVIYLFIHSCFFADVFSLAQFNPIENHYANIFKAGWRST